MSIAPRQNPRRSAPAPLRRGPAFLCLVALLVALCAPARAEQSVRYDLLIDPTRNLTLLDVTERAFTAVGDTFGGGFTTSVYWLRVTVDKPDPGLFLLRFRPITTDQIQLFTPLSGGGWRSSQSGETLRPSGDAVPSLNWYSFEIDPQKDKGPWYVRIDTRAPGAIAVTLIAADLSPLEDVSNAFVNIVNYALLFVAAAALIGTLDPLRSLANFGFLSITVSFGAYLFAYNGYAPVLFQIEPARAERVQEFLATFTIFGVSFFHHAFLLAFRPAKPLVWLGRAHVVLSAMAPLACMAGFGLIGIKIGVACYTSLVPLLAVTLLTLADDGPMRRWQLRLVYTGYLGLLALNISVRFGVLEIEYLYRHSVETITMVTATLMLALLWLQNRHALDAATARSLALEKLSIDLEIDRQFNAARQALLERIDAQVRDLSSGLGQSDRTPAYPRARRAVTAMRRVIDRCLFAQDATANRWNLRFVRFAPMVALRALTETMADPSAFAFPRAAADRLILTTDRDLFEIAAENVLSNALRYGLPKRPVQIELRAETLDGRDGLLLCITNAAASDPFDQTRVFEKFYRGPSSQDRGGTGVGLFIAHEVVQALSGVITLQCRPAPHGSDVTLCLWLPVSP